MIENIVDWCTVIIVMSFAVMAASVAGVIIVNVIKFFIQ